MIHSSHFLYTKPCIAVPQILYFWVHYVVTIRIKRQVGCAYQMCWAFVKRVVGRRPWYLRKKQSSFSLPPCIVEALSQLICDNTLERTSTQGACFMTLTQQKQRLLAIL